MRRRFVTHRKRGATCKFNRCGGDIVLFGPDLKPACLLCGRVPGSAERVPTPREMLETADRRYVARPGGKPIATGAAL